MNLDIPNIISRGTYRSSDGFSGNNSGDGRTNNEPVLEFSPSQSDLFFTVIDAAEN